MLIRILNNRQLSTIQLRINCYEQSTLLRAIYPGANNLNDLTPFHSRLDRSVSTHWLLSIVGMKNEKFVKN